MKNILYTVALALLGAFLLAGCNFLNLVPDGTSTEKDAFSNPRAALRYLYSCYGYIPNNSSTTGGIDFLSGDEVVTPFEHETFAQFAKGTYTASSLSISYWNDLFTGMRYCYALVDNVDKVPGIDPKDAEEYKAEAEFLIGYLHYLMIQNYGPTIIIEGVEDINAPVETFKARSSMAESVAFTQKILDSAASKLPDTRDGNEFGRATSVAAKAIKAKLLVLAASPLFNGYAPHNDVKNPDGTLIFEQSFDQGKWDLAYAATKEAVEAAETAGFGLYKAVAGANASIKEPSDLTQRSLRLAILDKENLIETVWGNTRGQGDYDIMPKSMPYGKGDGGGWAWNGVSPTLTMMKRFYTANGLPLDEDPAFPAEDDWWAVVDAPSDFKYGEGKVAKFVLNRDPRMYAWTTFQNGYYEIAGTEPKDSNYENKYRRGEGNAKIVMKMLIGEPSGRGASIDNLRNNDYSPSGFLNKRLVHPLRTAAQRTLNYIHPYVTMADLYLLHAETSVEVGKLEEGKAYLDKIRGRAGLPTVDAAWAGAKHPEKAKSKEGLRQIVRQERMIEMYLLNQNFWDLRRWLIAENYLGEIPYGVNTTATNIEAWWKPTKVDVARTFVAPRNYLMPIPQDEVNKNLNLVQNPGY